MQVQTASFLADNGLVPVMSTTPNMTRILAARRKPNHTWGVEWDSGPLGYNAMVFMKAARGLAGTENR